MPYVIGLCGGISAGKSTFAQDAAIIVEEKGFIPIIIDATKNIKKQINEVCPYTDIDSNIAAQSLLYTKFVEILYDFLDPFYVLEARYPKQKKFVIITTRTPLDHVYYLTELNKQQNGGADTDRMLDAAILFCAKFYSGIIFFGESYSDVPDKWKFLKNSGKYLYEKCADPLLDLPLEDFTEDKSLEERVEIFKENTFPEFKKGFKDSLDMSSYYVDRPI